jgi:hypothetical protein
VGLQHSQVSMLSRSACCRARWFRMEAFPKFMRNVNGAQQGLRFG